MVLLLLKKGGKGKVKFYKDYHFYVAISGFIVLIVGLITDYFGIFVEKGTLETIVSYILSFLIAFNVININVKKDKLPEEIKSDIDKTATALENQLNSNLSKNEKSGNKNAKGQAGTTIEAKEKLAQGEENASNLCKK